LDSVTPYIFTALTLALLGAIDSLLTSVVADNMTKTKHKPNKELIGQGIGNSIAALFGGIPGAGATIRTVVNINAGGKTRFSGMIAGILLLIILLALGPVASKIPAAVLAGILITVGIGVMDYKGLKAIPYMPKQEVAIMLLVLVLSSVWNLVYAVGIGLVIASLIFMKIIGDISAKRSEVKSLKEEVIDEFLLFDDWMQKYEYMIDLGKSLPLINENNKTDDRLIKGCQSKVWLDAQLKNGKINYTADSDAIITKGIIAILLRVFSNQTPDAILSANTDFIDEIGLKEHLSPTRANGLVSMIKQLKIYALALKAQKQ
jgi:MFS superfamily sulfate permease-like transporter